MSAGVDTSHASRVSPAAGKLLHAAGQRPMPRHLPAVRAPAGPWRPWRLRAHSELSRGYCVHHFLASLRALGSASRDLLHPVQHRNSKDVLRRQQAASPWPPACSAFPNTGEPKSPLSSRPFLAGRLLQLKCPLPARRQPLQRLLHWRLGRSGGVQPGGLR